MFLFILILFLVDSMFLWLLLIASKMYKTDEEKFIEDNLQMEYLKSYNSHPFKL